LSRQGWIIAAVVVVIGVTGARWWQSRSAQKAPKFRTAAVERGLIESLVSATGTVRPVEQVEVGSQVSGTVQKLFADYNDRVRAGQVLCQLEPSSFRARVAQSEAAVARAEAALKDARRQLARARELIAQNYVSQADVDAVEVAVEQREAELKQARAQLQAAAVDLANTTIHAPINGIVIARSVDLGQTVAASLQAPKLFVIANDLSQMQVETRIDEADIGVIHPELAVRFTVDAFPDMQFQGRVAQVRLEPIVEQGVVTYTTVIRTDNPQLKLRPGMTANVSVLVAEREDAIKVPNAALRFRPPTEGRERDRMARGDGAGGGAMAATQARGGGKTRDAARGMAGWRERRDAAGARPGMPGSNGKGAPVDPGAGRRPGASRADGGEAGPSVAASEAWSEEAPLRPGTLYVLRDGRPMAVPVMTGLTDGAFTEVRSEQLKPDDRVIVGLELSAQGQNLQPPPGMGGPQFGGGGRRGGGR
jgi:HlyD family secretion protein